MAIGTMACVDPRNGREWVIIGLSGAPEVVEPMARAVASQFPSNYVVAPTRVDPAYWAGRDDPRFQPGKNSDGSPYEGDSSLCAIPRMYQLLAQRGWRATSMSLAWKGEGHTNPFPREPGDPASAFMHPCPSCAANAGALMGAGPGATSPASTSAAPSVWSRLVGFFRGGPRA